MSVDERARTLTAQICAATSAHSARIERRIQTLWSGYGQIVRATLSTPEGARSVIVKHVSPPVNRLGEHESARRSHLRKLRSYQVEMAWYQGLASRCDEHCRIPEALACSAHDGQWLFVLEDLDAAGFALRRSTLSADELALCLGWLAAFHARFLGVAPTDLWPIGTYWPLGTRPDELAALTDSALRTAAPAFDARLNACSFLTLVHGDAKVENFCFARAASAVAAVDFQYVGAGCGIKDVVYFLSSCLSSDECEQGAAQQLDLYFRALRTELAQNHPDVDAGALEAEWRALYPVAWADLYRFLSGWAPGHYDHHRYGQRLTREVMRSLGRS